MSYSGYVVHVAKRRAVSVARARVEAEFTSPPRWMPLTCEGCGLKQPSYGLASEGKARWCAGCGKAEGAVYLPQKKKAEDTST